MTAFASTRALDFRSGLVDARVLITGGSGFIGTNLVAAYRDAGVSVTNVDTKAPQDDADRSWVRADVRRLEEVRSVFSDVRPTHVFHLAARTDLDGRSIEDYDTNTVGVANLLSVLDEPNTQVRRAVIASSRLVCRIGYRPHSDDDYCPTTSYGESKVATERLVRAATAVPWVLVRPTSIWGPWFGVPYRDFFVAVARGRYLHPARQRILKSFGFVGNTVWQLHSLMTAREHAVQQRTFYLADDPPIEVSDLAARISAAVQRKPPVHVPLAALRAAARVGDALEGTRISPPLTTFRLTNLLTPMVHDLQNLVEVTGSPPYDQQSGVTATIEWMRSRGVLDQSQS